MPPQRATILSEFLEGLVVVLNLLAESYRPNSIALARKSFSVAQRAILAD